MKILISTDFYTHNLGGVTTSVIGLSAGLRSLGHEVRILTLSDNNTSTHEGDVYSIRSFSAEYSPDMRMSLAISCLRNYQSGIPISFTYNPKDRLSFLPDGSNGIATFL